MKKIKEQDFTLKAASIYLQGSELVPQPDVERRAAFAESAQSCLEEATALWKDFQQFPGSFLESWRARRKVMVKFRITWSTASTARSRAQAHCFDGPVQSTSLNFKL